MVIVLKEAALEKCHAFVPERPEIFKNAISANGKQTQQHVCARRKLDTSKQRSKGKASITHSLSEDSEAEIARTQSRVVFVLQSCNVTCVV